MEKLIYTEAYISKSLDGDIWELDPNGNPYIIIEASNENLDYDQEKVLRSALMKSADIFLETGVVSFDHRHLSSPTNRAYDPSWNAEKYIIGKPVEVWEAEGKNGKTVFVKAVLSKSNDIANEIIKKLKDGIATVKASVGGRRVSKEVTRDNNSHMEVDTIVSVEWNEIALTYKPVNQTLGETILCPVGFEKSVDDYETWSPDIFVKAMTAGSSADPANMGNGGNTLQTQSLEGDAINTLMMGIRDGKLKGKEAITHLMEKGCSETRAKQILKMIIDNNYIGDVMKADGDNVEEVTKSVAEDLQKALDDMDTLSKGKKDGIYKMKGGHEYMKKADGKYEKTDENSPDYEDDDDDEEDDTETVNKSIGDDNAIDATEIVTDLQKSMKTQSSEIKDLSSMVKSLVKMNAAQGNVLKSMASMGIEQDTLIKAIAGTPQQRQAATDNLNLDNRFKPAAGDGTLSKSQKDSLSKITDVNIMVKSLVDEKVDPVVRQRACGIFNQNKKAGGDGISGVIQHMPELLTALSKEV